MPLDRLREQAVDAALLDFLRDQADADEHGDEQPEDRGGGEAEVLDDLHVLSGRELADQVRRGHQQDREEHEVVEHLVAHRLAEHVDGDRRRWPHHAGPMAPLEPAVARQHFRRGHLLDEEVLERVAQRVERHAACAPAADSSREKRSGAGVERQFEHVAAVAERVTRVARDVRRAISASADVGGDQLPSRGSGTPACR